MENELKTEKLDQFVIIGNKCVLTDNLTPIDIVVYASIKRFDGPDGCYPSLETLCNKTMLSKPTLLKCIKNLIRSKWMTCSCEGRGHYTYYTFLKDEQFEPVSYKFLDMKDLDINCKGYLICLQQFMYKNSVNEGAVMLSAEQISKMINMPVRTVYKVEQTLREKGILKISANKNTDLVTQSHNKIRKYNFDQYFQAIAYILRHHEDKLKLHDEQLENIQITIRENDSKVKTIEDNMMKMFYYFQEQLSKKVDKKREETV